MKYFNAGSPEEALLALKEARGQAKVIAGGTDVIVDYKAGKICPEVLVDISGIESMKRIQTDDKKMYIGAAVTLAEISKNPTVLKYYPSLADGCGRVGSLQIRNSATLVGNVVSAQPAGDGAVALSALLPVFTVLGEEGERKLTMSEMYAGFGRTTIDTSAEIVTGVEFDLPLPGEAAAFGRLQLRQSLSLPMLNCAAKLSTENGIITGASITMSPVGVGPVHAVDAEEYLIGKEMTDDVFMEAGNLSLNNANPRSNPLRGSREFRIETLPVMIRRSLEDCRAQIMC